MRTKKVKPPPKDYEYQLLISNVEDEITRKNYIAFQFRTTKEFLTFPYILKIESKVKDNKLNFKILGFSAPLGELSNPGHAGYEFRLYDFKSSEYSISVEKKDSAKSKFTLVIPRTKNSSLKVKRLSDKSFIEVITD